MQTILVATGKRPGGFLVSILPFLRWAKRMLSFSRPRPWSWPHGGKSPASLQWAQRWQSRAGAVFPVPGHPDHVRRNDLAHAVRHQLHLHM